MLKGINIRFDEKDKLTITLDMQISENDVGEVNYNPETLKTIGQWAQKFYHETVVKTKPKIEDKQND